VTSAAAASRAFAELARVPSKVARKVATGISAEIQKNFDLGLDVYGRPWAPLAPATLRKGRTPPPLTDTGAGRESIEVKPTRGAGIGIKVGTRYMRFHQSGASKGNWRLPIRMFLPTNVLPKAWRKIYVEALAEMTAAALRVTGAKRRG
jgi:phage gpG-like protein